MRTHDHPTPGHRAAPPAADPTGGTGRGALWWLLGVCLVTAAYSAIPLLGSTRFYMRGDTAAQFAPVWHHLGELVRAGHWPPTLDADAWAGGNYAAEALYGVYNPLNLLIWLVVSGSGDLLVAVTLVKCLVLVLLAAGVFLLAREYAAAPWAAASVATAVPFSGFTLYWDAGSWPSGLIAFAYLPWVLLTWRRLLHGRGRPVPTVLAAFVVGALAITQGNPYGTLGVVAAGLGLVTEALLRRQVAGLLRLLAVGAAVAAFLPLVYLPLLDTSALTYRADGELFANNGKMRPRLTDLLGLSFPTYEPPVRAVIGTMAVPATYLAWFVLPLLPWLRFGVLRARARELSGLAVVGLVYLLMTLGPSQMWLFRWPLRLTEYLYLIVAVALAVVLSQGLHRDRLPARAVGSLALVGLTTYLAWAEHPDRLRAVGGGALVLGALALALVALAVVVGRRRPLGGALLAVLLVAGTGAGLGLQTAVYGENASSRPWAFPGDVSQLRSDFAAYDGRVMQFATFPREQPDDGERLSRNWDTFLAGSMLGVAGVDAVNNYTGMGFERFSKRLCLSYEGYTEACGYRNVWEPVAEGEPALVDLMKLDTLLVQPRLARGITPDEGWVEQRRGDALVVERTAATPWPGSRLAWAEDGVSVESASSDGVHDETVRLSTDGEPGRLVFAMLAWPGYEVTLDGRPLPLVEHPAGLLSVRVPADAAGELRVEYTPPGQAMSLAAAGGGTLLAVAVALLAWRAGRRRRGGPEEPVRTAGRHVGDDPVHRPEHPDDETDDADDAEKVASTGGVADGPAPRSGATPAGVPDQNS